MVSIDSRHREFCSMKGNRNLVSWLAGAHKIGKSMRFFNQALQIPNAPHGVHSGWVGSRFGIYPILRHHVEERKKPKV